jgi:hypothetical protein
MNHRPHRVITALGLCACLGLCCATWVGWDAALGAGAGDFTWRTQEISTINVFLLPLGWLAAMCAGTVRFRSECGARRCLWFGVIVAGSVGLGLSAYVYSMHELGILRWNANVPPADWQEVRDQWMPWAVTRVWIARVLLLVFMIAVLFSGNARKQGLNGA